MGEEIDADGISAEMKKKRIGLIKSRVDPDMLYAVEVGWVYRVMSINYETGEVVLQTGDMLFKPFRPEDIVE